MTRLAVFASGRGSNLARIVAACESGEMAAQVALVVCNEPDAGVTAIAREAGIPVFVADHRDFPSRVAHERAIAVALREHAIDLVVLAGYMRLLSPFLLGVMFDPALGVSRVVNIHPADTRAYQGTDGYGWAIAAGLAETAVTVHFVDEGKDTGPIILQERLEVRPGETRAQLMARGLTLEHRLYPLAIQQVLARLEEPSACAAF